MFTPKVFALILLISLIPSQSSGQDDFCKYKGKKICNGAVTKELKKIVQICEDGRLKYKKKSKVGAGYPLAGGDCEFYGKVYCAGASVLDLYSWWFKNTCSNNKMRPVGRPWAEVVRDPRFIKYNGNN